MPDAVVWCDPQLVVQALVNLLDNALRHTPPGSAVRLRVALRHAAQTSLAGQSSLIRGDLCIDLDAKAVLSAGEPVRSTATEWRLLDALAKRADRVVTSRQLRQKLAADPAHPVLLLTETSVGARLHVSQG